MPRGRRKNAFPAPVIIHKPKAPKPAYRSVRDLVSMMERYQAIAGDKSRGMFEDCKADIYRLFLVDYNDRQVDEIVATGYSDQIYSEWESRFVRAFGRLERDAA